MKKLIIFILLKVFELVTFVGAAIGLAYYGKFVFKILGASYCFTAPFDIVEFLVCLVIGGIMLGFFLPAFVIVLLIVLCEKNWEWSSEILNKLNRKGKK